MQGSSVARECILDILDIEQGVIMHRLHRVFLAQCNYKYDTLQYISSRYISVHRWDRASDD